MRKFQTHGIVFTLFEDPCGERWVEILRECDCELIAHEHLDDPSDDLEAFAEGWIRLQLGRRWPAIIFDGTSAGAAAHRKLHDRGRPGRGIPVQAMGTRIGSLAMDDVVRSEISPADGGRWLVETESGSRHLLDLDEMTFQRRGPRGKGDRAREVSDVHQIIEIEQVPRINSQFAVVLAGPEPDTESYLTSTYVTRITALGFRDEPTTDLPELSLLEQVAQIPPSNAWLLVGDEASYPTSAELGAQRDDVDPDLAIWTCPRQIQRGDLVFIYFLAPTKAVHFAARAMCAPVYDPSIGVNARRTVDPHQWWTELSPLVEVPAITFGRLKHLHGGNLILKGKPTHYLKPPIVEEIVADFAELDREQQLVLQIPIGDPNLPDPTRMQLDDVRRLAAGVLQPEAKVEQYFVEPLLRLCFTDTSGVRFEPQLKIPGAGVADYGIRDDGGLLAVVEVKIGIRRQSRGKLDGSPDLAQLRRYTAATGVPGLLIDANDVFLVGSGHNEPVHRLERQHLTPDHLAVIVAHVGGR